AAFGILYVHRQKYFCVALGAKADASGGEFCAQFEVVIDLAIEDNGIPSVWRRPRLRTAAEVNNAKAAVTETGCIKFYYTTVVRTAMSEPLHGKLHSRLIRAYARGNDMADYSAHGYRVSMSVV